MKTKTLIIALVILSQVFFVKYVIIPECKRARVTIAASAQKIEVGSVWGFEQRDPFKGKGLFWVEVLDATNGYVKYCYGGKKDLVNSDSESYFRIGYHLCTNAPTKANQ
jgi:hypothetical protein